MEVEVREEILPADSTALLANNTSHAMSDGPVVIVRAEEVLLVVLVLILWVAAIALFINRWGKIRMLEPYQPKFQSQNHRPSCPLAPLSPPHITPQQRMSFSKYNVNCFGDYSGLPSPNSMRRPRLNSVFVGSSTMAFMNPPRRVKSAIDIQHLVLTSDRTPAYRSMLPMISYRERKPSITVDRPYCHSSTISTASKHHHRPSLASDRPLLSHYQQFRTRRSSCAVDTRHRNFISFDQPRRKASMAIERPSCSYQGPMISFESSTPGGSIDHPSVVVNRPKYSRSFEQPTDFKTLPPPRMAASLDVNAASFDRRTSIPEEDVEVEAIESAEMSEMTSALAQKNQEIRKSSSVIVMFDEADVTANAPLLERLKSSDV
ncbi:uncharacterized protein [Atheta coriaria]|uniref:uncharacterized protein isoform X1 n=1 Tax=Dalotia coriaria TaxID=877792 RepID=UPI0031F38641